MKSFKYEDDFDEWFKNARSTFIQQNTPLFMQQNLPFGMLDGPFIMYLYDGLLQTMCFKTNRSKSMYLLYMLMKDIKEERLHL